MPRTRRRAPRRQTREFFVHARPRGRPEKLSDFGLAARQAADQNSPEQCGTRLPQPRDGRGRPYDFKLDARRRRGGSALLASGYAPFRGLGRRIRERRAPTKHGLLRNVRRGKPETPVERSRSPKPRDRRPSPITVDPDKRGRAEAAEQLLGPREGRRVARGRVGEHRRRAVQARRDARTAECRASIRAALGGDVFRESLGECGRLLPAAATMVGLVRAPGAAAEEACANHDECDVGDDVDFETGGASTR